MTDDGVNTYVWDAENRPTKITGKTTGHISTFGYDGLGRRVTSGERDPGNPQVITTWFWCQGSATPCGTVSPTNTATFFGQGEVNTGQTPSSLYYVRDHLGSVIQTADLNSNVLASRSYGEYGKLYNASGTATPTMGYAGMYMHAATGLYLTPNRVYDAKDGRWLSKDPLEEEGGTNVYGYVGGDPLSYTDPFGSAAVGHHFVIGPIRNDPNLSPAARDVFQREITGPIPGGHNYGDDHSDYNKGVKELWDKFLKDRNNLKVCNVTEAQANEFVTAVKQSSDPRIRNFNVRIYTKILWGIVRRLPTQGESD